MGAYLSEPVTDKSSVEEKGELVSYGASAMQGWRTTQEDSHNCIPNFDKDGSLFAVYDGHGGAEVALYCSIHLPDYIKSIESFKQGNIVQALEDAFLGFDESLTRPEVKSELKQLAGKHVKNPEEAGKKENELDNLYAEANMPLEDVLSKYNSAFTLQVARLKGQKTNSPYISSKDKVVSKIKAESVDESESVDKDLSKQPDLSNGVEDKSENEIKKKISEEVDKDKKEVIKSEPTSSSSSSLNDGNSSMPGCSSAKPGSSNSRSCKSRVVNSDEGNEDDTSSSEDETYQEIPFADSDTDEEGVEEGEKDEGDEEEEEDDDDDDDDEEDEDDEEEETEEEIDLELENEPGSESGCTAVVAVVKGTVLYVANAGDSRCVVCRNGKAIDMSVDHKPEEEIEMKRIVNAGGRVTSDGRVNGGLNLSRAIGDHTYKQNKSLSLREQMITSLPDVRTLTLDPKEDEFMVLACDGIWNYMRSQEVIDFVKERLDKHSLSTICEELFDLCLAPNTHGDGTGCDNMTAIVVRFHSSLGELKTEVGNAKRKLENGDLIGESGSKRVKKNNEEAN